MKPNIRLWVVVLGAALWVESALGAGFALYEGSARGNALGGTLVAREPDASVLYYNAAGMTGLRGTHIMAGFSAVDPGTDVTTLGPAGAETTSTEHRQWMPPHLYGTHQLKDNLWLGLGLFSRFGLGTEFDENWPGRYNSTKAVIRSLNLNPDVAWKAGDKVSFAAGLSATWFDLELDRRQPYLPGQDVDVSIEGDSIGYGFNLGLKYQVLDGLALGASYQSEVDHEVEGDVGLGRRSTGAQGDVTLPDFLFLGVSVTPVKKLSIEAGAVRTGWGSYDELALDLDDPTLLGTSRVSVPKDWDDVWRYAVGVEYELTKKWDLRLGYVYDPEPGPDRTADYMIPASDRQLFSVGAGCQWDRWTLDISYTYLDVDSRTIAARPAEGVLDSEFDEGDAHILGVSLSTAFGGRPRAVVTAP